MLLGKGDVRLLSDFFSGKLTLSPGFLLTGLEDSRTTALMFPRNPEVSGGGRNRLRAASHASLHGHGPAAGAERVYAGAGGTDGSALDSRPTRSSTQKAAVAKSYGPDAQNMTLNHRENRKLGLSPLS